MAASTPGQSTGGPQRKRSVLILGVHAAGEAYPNVLYRLQAIQGLAGLDTRELNEPLWRRGIANRSLLAAPLLFGKAFLAHLRLLIRYLLGEVPDVLYVPYPAPGVLLLLACLPRRRRPQWVVADAFISLYDTVVNDRQMLNANSGSARMLFALEGRALRAADCVIADTAMNAQWLARSFGLAEHQVRALPLSTNEHDYHSRPYAGSGRPLRILYVGTFVPLHGMATVIGAARLLAERADLEFEIIGDGRDAPLLQSALQQDPGLRVRWRRQWQPPAVVAKAIDRADICLGIFGRTAKAQRVCPFKLYAYACVGRPVIPGDTLWAREAVARTSGSPPFALVAVGDAPALAKAIVELADDPARRRRLAEQSRQFYAAHLSNDVANRMLADCLGAGGV